MSKYIVVGDTKRYKECLIYTCCSKEIAEEVLNRMKTNPTKDDLRFLETHSNLKVVEVKDESCWWNDPFLAN